MVVRDQAQREREGGGGRRRAPRVRDGNEEIQFEADVCLMNTR